MKKKIKTKCYKCGRIYFEQPKERTKPFLIFVDSVTYKFDMSIKSDNIIIISDNKKCSNCGRLFYKKKMKLNISSPINEKNNFLMLLK